jgi:hypothetical protein
VAKPTFYRAREIGELDFLWILWISVSRAPMDPHWPLTLDNPRVVRFRICSMYLRWHEFSLPLVAALHNFQFQ